MNPTRGKSARFPRPSTSATRVVATHTIRLRAPWDVERHPDRVIFRRYFNRPTGLGPADVVRLAIDGLQPGTRVHINASELPPDAVPWDITSQLQPRNAVTIEAGGNTAERPFGEVHLEIEAPR